jgi:hypothetical protein
MSNRLTVKSLSHRLFFELSIIVTDIDFQFKKKKRKKDN